MKDQSIVEVEFAELSDGSLVEMIEDPADPTQSLLAVYREGLVVYQKSVVDGPRTLVPLSRTGELARHVRLAQAAEPYGQVVDLEKKVAALFNSCLDIESDSRALMIAFVISTWFREKLPVAPYLVFVGPPGSGKTTALRILSLLCYRSLLTADITSAAFYEISHGIHPTILLDETLTAGNSRELIHLLKVSNTPDFVSLRRGKSSLAYGPKAFSWLELPNDPALNSRCVVVPMHKSSRTDLIPLNDPRVARFVELVRAQLLQLRFESYRTVSMPKNPPTVELFDRPLDLFRGLALPFEQDPSMQEYLGLLIKKQSWFQMPLLSPAQASALRVLYATIHKFPGAIDVPLSSLTAAVNVDLKGHGEMAALNERRMGNILTSLSFTNRFRRNSGYVLCLERSDRVRIHGSARDFRVEGISAGPIEDCEICTPRTTLPAPSAAAEASGEKKGVSEDSKSERSERGERETQDRTGGTAVNSPAAPAAAGGGGSGASASLVSTDLPA